MSVKTMFAFVHIPIWFEMIFCFMYSICIYLRKMVYNMMFIDIDVCVI